MVYPTIIHFCIWKPLFVMLILAFLLLCSISSLSFSTTHTYNKNQLLTDQDRGGGERKRENGLK